MKLQQVYLRDAIFEFIPRCSVKRNLRQAAGNSYLKVSAMVIAHKGERVVFQTTSRNISKDIIIGIAVTSLIFLISVVIPLIGFFSALFIPLPTLFYRSKLGRKSVPVIPLLSPEWSACSFTVISPTKGYIPLFRNMWMKI